MFEGFIEGEEHMYRGNLIVIHHIPIQNGWSAVASILNSSRIPVGGVCGQASSKEAAIMEAKKQAIAYIDQL